MNQLPILDCGNCGACCLQQESPPMYLLLLLNPQYREHYPEDAARVVALPGRLKRELHLYSADMKAGKPHPRGGVCLWYDEATKGCGHYDLRPEICRDFEVNSKECHQWREEYRIGE